MILLHALTQLDGFSDTDQIDGDGGGRGHRKLRRGLATCGRPIRTEVVVHCLRRLEPSCRPRRIRGGELSLEQVALVEAAKPGSELLEQSDVLRVELPGV